MAEMQLSPTDRFERILLSSDGTEFSHGAERLAVQLTQKFGAHLYIMRMLLSNVEFEGFAPAMLEKDKEAAYQHIETIKNTLMTGDGSSKAICTPVIRYGSQPHEEILDLVDEVNADLVVMGRRGRRGLARMMVGHATSHVVGKAHCKVLVAPRASNLWEKKILLATDGSRYSDAAGVVSCTLAKLFNLPLVVVSVTKASHSASRQEEARIAVDKVVKHAQSLGVNVEGLLQQGRPESVIVEIAQAKECDLIVGGSHGRSGMEKILLGSVMDRLIGETFCPVLVVK